MLMEILDMKNWKMVWHNLLFNEQREAQAGWVSNGF
jgi:hypothetical protein